MGNEAKMSNSDVFRLVGSSIKNNILISNEENFIIKILVESCKSIAEDNEINMQDLGELFIKYGNMLEERGELCKNDIQPTLEEKFGEKANNVGGMLLLIDRCI